MISDLIVAPTAHLINSLTPSVNVTALGDQVQAAGGGIVVLKGCESVEVMFMLAAAFAVLQLPWRRRVAG